jgi:large subunit ribosomal protein L32e
MLPNGFYKFVVSNVEDLDLLLMHNRKYCAEVIAYDYSYYRGNTNRGVFLLQIASNVSASKRKEIVSRAEQISVRVINAHARLRAEEAE